MNLTMLQTDERGTIELLTGDPLVYPEVTIFHTKQGYARGGCIHPNSDEYTTVIQGSVIYVIGDKYVPLTAGQSTLIPKNTPHYYESITDSICIEWGANPAEKKNKYQPFREIVVRINEEHTSI